MGSITICEIESYIEKHLPEFYDNRLEGLNKLNLDRILKRKNPYLFRVKNYDVAHDVVKSIVDAHISSSDEAVFGNWLEALVIFINGKVYSGVKSGILGIDLEFIREDIRYLVAIKSGPNWGNSDQIRKMVANFNTAKKTLRTSDAKIRIEFVNGCCYGKCNDNLRQQGYYKYCGQKFWEFISNEKDLYLDIIEPLGKKAKQRSDEYQEKYNGILNKITGDFVREYCDNKGKINWELIVRLNSSYEQT